jgi:hypothetical protein
MSFKELPDVHVQRKPCRYCGRVFSVEEMATIDRIVNTKGFIRADIARNVCRELNWLKADGHLKEMSCKVALLRMEKDGWFTLPPPTRGNGNCTPYRHSNLMGDSHQPLRMPVGDFGSLRLELVRSQTQSKLWNEMIHRWHYLGFKKLVGAQLRYLVDSDQGVLGGLSFSASAWNVQPREDFIGWNHHTRKQNLHLIVNNSRFLILPWIRSKNLASKILSLAAKRIAEDWEERYNYRPVLLETFVEKKRFNGTCYKAANWINLGETKGRGKLGDHSMLYSNIKYVMIYPIHCNFRSILQTNSLQTSV